jgi:hypothetical protein
MRSLVCACGSGELREVANDEATSPVRQEGSRFGLAGLSHRQPVRRDAVGADGGDMLNHSLILERCGHGLGV